MSGHNALYIAVVLLLAAVVFVPLSKKLGLGSVLGYLLAGIFVGPWGLQLITNVEDIMHFSEFGVVLFLFLIGLELDPKKLWSLRVPIFAMGGAQVLFNVILLTLLVKLVGFSWNVSIMAGMGFCLSSTAIGLQALQEKNLLNTKTGQSAFSVLLFQDIAVIPMIALLPLLAPLSPDQSKGSAWLGFAKVLIVLILVVLVGRFLLRSFIRVIASVHLREVFTAFALLLVLGMAYLMARLDISMGLGAFIAGVLLADSEYRHALETDIEPFKGLLLGLFFMSVGMSINFASIYINPGLIFALVVGILLIKLSVHFAIAKAFDLPVVQRFYFSVVISQVGEFAFVLFGAALALKIIDKDMSGVFVAIVALTMLSTPLLSWAYDTRKRFSKTQNKPASDAITDDGSPVIIAGFGRFGQIIGRLLYANKIPATVLDHEPDQIELLRRFGFKIYYGDATRLDLLEAAGAARAKILVVAIDDVDDNLKVVDLARQHFPHLRIMARARNVAHYYSLIERRVELVEREVFESSLKMGVDVLRVLGWPAHQAVRAANQFRKHNIEMIYDMQKDRSNDKDLISKAKQGRIDLENMFEEERVLREKGDGGWE